MSNTINAIKSFVGQYWAALLVFFSPIKIAILAIICIVILDFILGIIRSKKQGKPITSHKMRRTLVKLACYLVAILTGFIIERCLFASFEISKIIASLIGLVELKSILESLNSLSGGKIWKQLIDYINGPSMKE
jgi:phage-related holin